MAIFLPLFAITQLLALVIIVLFSLMRENLRELRENLKHKIRAPDASLIKNKPKHLALSV